ncbi:Phospholipase A(1) LCAT3 [Linum grandiflorum]
MLYSSIIFVTLLPAPSSFLLPFQSSMLKLCPCFYGRCSGTAVSKSSDLDPVLLVSGMGGSILNSIPKKTGLQTRVWVRFLLAELEFKNKVWSIYNPDTGYTEVLNKDTEIVVPQDDYGLYAIDILDPSPVVKCVHLTEVYHFHDMIEMLVDCGHKKGTTLFGYGYDFRQSNRISNSMEGLKAKLETAYEASGNRKVNIITHSMGGLLVSCFMSLYNDSFKATLMLMFHCCSCIGAPGCINDSILTGLQFVEGFENYFFVSRWTMHQLLVECPSIYEMFPNPAFKWAKEPQIQVWWKKSDDDGTSTHLESYGLLDSTRLFEEALKNNELSYGGNTIALPFNMAILNWATETRQMLNDVELLEGVSFYNIYGTSHDTPFDVCYGSESSPVEDLSEVCHTTPEYSFVDGDGTVPAESAKADGYAATERIGIAGEHRGILRDEKVFKLIKKWLGVEEPESKPPIMRAKVRDSHVFI